MPSTIFHFKPFNTKIPKFVILTLLFILSTKNHVLCFNVNYPTFGTDCTNGDLKCIGDSRIDQNALQVTRDSGDGTFDPIFNQSGRILYHKKFKLWKNDKLADFNSTFVINIQPGSNGSSSSGGEGLAFILAKDSEVPDNSSGPWLGIVNASTNGSLLSSIVAIEFDTNKSFTEDIDSNHVGLNINSVYSTQSFSLNSSNIRILSSTNITGMVMFNGSTKMLNVYVIKGNTIGPNLPSPVISRQVNLTKYLPSDVYIGFSASTGSSTELNCVRAWYFSGSNLDKELTLWVKIMVPVSISLVLVLSLAGGFFYRRRKLKLVDPSDSENTITGIERGLGPKKIKLKDIKVGTGNFNAKNKLGNGGFGIVYLGILDGNEVAVKRIKNTPAGKQNLIAEITTIGSVHHKNLVKLIGWCHENNELILVYEYMPNRSLDYYIDLNGRNEHENKPILLLTWERRHNIICGVAQAIDYLHNECSSRVLHRDIKDSNIMLDAEFNACLGDFGLARMFKLSEKTHHSTKEIAGTFGYMAPEIFHTGRATSETDVYAFGVLALVVACGKKALFETEGSEYKTSIVDWAWQLHRLDKVVEAMDPNLEGIFDKGQAECMLMLGLACCHPNPYMRPSMRNALQVLMGESPPPLVSYNKPAFIWPATSPSFISEDSLSAEILSISSSLSDY